MSKSFSRFRVLSGEDFSTLESSLCRVNPPFRSRAGSIIPSREDRASLPPRTLFDEWNAYIPPRRFSSLLPGPITIDLVKGINVGRSLPRAANSEPTLVYMSNGIACPRNAFITVRQEN